MWVVEALSMVILFIISAVVTYFLWKDRRRVLSLMFGINSIFCALNVALSISKGFS